MILILIRQFKVGSKTGRKLESWVDKSWEIIGSPCCEGAILRIQNAQIRMIANYMRLEVQLDFFFQILWLGYGEGEENVWRWWYWKSLTHLCLYISFYIIYLLTWILQESLYSAMFSRKARIEISSILMMHLDWTRAMQSGGHKVGCSKSGRAWRLCILDSWFEMLATLPPSLQLPEKESD